MSSEIVKRLTSNDFKTEISDVTRLKFRVHAFLILTAAVNWMIDFHLTVRFYRIRFDTSLTGIKLSTVTSGNRGKYLFLKNYGDKKAATNVILMLKHQISPKIRFMGQNLHI